MAKTANASARRPVAKTPPILFERTQKIISALETALDQKVVTYWNSTNGNICANDVIGLYGVLQSIGRAERLALFIKSGGGSGQSSLRLVNLLRQYAKELTALVPLECTSAATMLALGANKILMGPLAQLSAVDTSLTHDLSPLDKFNDRVAVSQDELQRIVRLWREQATTGTENPFQSLFPHIHPLVIGAVDRASALSIRLCVEILAYHMRDQETAQKISETLNAAYPSHTYPILEREARNIGLNVEAMPDPVNKLLLELNELYSEMGQDANTDFDERNSHDNSILNIIEGLGAQVFFQNDKDWHYRVEERRWVTLNNVSAWRKAEKSAGKLTVSILHIR
ncbi:MAG: hypothetical protein HXY21_07150 [Parvularculaceae bacterium]|nr:hypothetical protein [Parvularculaceae bacterium]